MMNNLRLLFFLLITVVNVPWSFAQDEGGEDDDNIIPPRVINALTEGLSRTDVSMRLQPLGFGLMGDQIDPHTGSLVFSVTDVAIPGNNALEVAIRRTAMSADATKLSREPTDREQMFLADWELDIPRVSNLMEKPNQFGGVGTAVTCSRGHNGDEAGFSEGFVLHVPGQGSKKLLKPIRGYSNLIPRHVIWDGFDTPPDYVTKDYWQISCVSGTDNFRVVAPNGTRYTMSHYTELPAMPYDTRDPNTNKSVRPGGIAQRLKSTWYATEVSDVSGNWVRYDYDSSGKLTRIHSNDGREITVSYIAGTKNISTVVANGRTWRYTYRERRHSDNITFRVLDKVTLPDYTFWEYDLEYVTYEYNSNNESSVIGLINLPVREASVKHPNGAIANYEFDYTLHAFDRVWVPAWVSYYERVEEGNYAVTRKTLTSDTFTQSSDWHFEYEEALNHRDAEPLDQTRWTRTIRPDGSVVEKHTYKYGVLQGQTKTQIIKASSTNADILEEKQYTYIVGESLGLSESLNGSRNSQQITTPHFVSSIVTKNNGDILTERLFYATNPTSTLYSYGKPLTKTIQGDPAAGLRIFSYGYEHRKNHWVLNLKSRETQNGKTFEEHGFDALGRTEWTKHFGVERFRYSYHTSNSQKGAIAWVTDALNRRTGFAGYKRGVPYWTTFPDGVTLYRSVDDNGWLTRETNGRGITTEYSYNKVGWLESVDRPSPFSDITIRYSDVGNGTEQTIIEGSKETTVYYDALHRPTRERIKALSGGGQTTYTKKYYDAMGRVSFTSFPSFSWNATSGTRTYYDGLGRKTWDIENVSPYATTQFEYLNGNRTQITDPMGNKTAYTYDGFEGPGKGALTRISQPMQTETMIERDIWGKVTRLRQYGTHNGFSVDQSQFFTYDNRFRLCRHHTAETGSTLYGYDDVDNITAEVRGASDGTECVSTLPSAGKITTEYDERDRPLIKTYWENSLQEEVVSTYQYDENGNIKHVNNRHIGGDDIGIRYDYNEIDLLTLEYIDYDRETLYIHPDGTEEWDELGYLTRYQYDADANVERITTPKNHRIDYTYNGLGQVVGATATSSVYRSFERITLASAQDLTYHANGTLKTMTYGNGLTTYFGQDQRQRLSAINVVGQNEESILGHSFRRDAAGRITSEHDLMFSGDSRSYNYDELGRLTSASGPWGSGKFIYDALGNLRRKELGSRTVSIDYNTNNQVSRTWDSANGSQWRSYSHDARGNVTNNGRLWLDHGSAYPMPVTATTYVMLINTGGNGSPGVTSKGSASSVSAGSSLLPLPLPLPVPMPLETNRYWYDGNGRRAMQDVTGFLQEDSVKTASFYSKSGELIIRETLDNGNYRNSAYTEYVRVAGKTIARIDKENSAETPQAQYIHQNHLGSPIASTSANGSVNWRESYTPFGEKAMSSAANEDNVGFTGHVQDSSTDLTYMQARFYDPAIGRFLSNDPVGFKASKPYMFNRYAYVGNNPVNRIDPFGRESYDDPEDIEVEDEGVDMVFTLSEVEASEKDDESSSGRGGDEEEEEEGKVEGKAEKEPSAKARVGQVAVGAAGTYGGALAIGAATTAAGTAAGFVVLGAGVLETLSGITGESKEAIVDSVVESMEAGFGDPDVPIPYAF